MEDENRFPVSSDFSPVLNEKLGQMFVDGGADRSGDLLSPVLAFSEVFLMPDVLACAQHIERECRRS
ncbi:hypothetical protein [Acetobacter persici]|uniref:hypothetical protein n=1 Tax=Acetobacter persici TaxID=1076596 RepID=UPI0012E08833|nr:hypothetical protein [Acetobacter persici]MCG0998911.1 hypothetical protein [Acetobacter persici]